METLDYDKLIKEATSDYLRHNDRDDKAELIPISTSTGRRKAPIIWNTASPTPINTGRRKIPKGSSQNKINTSSNDGGTAILSTPKTHQKTFASLDARNVATTTPASTPKASVTITGDSEILIRTGETKNRRRTRRHRGQRGKGKGKGKENDRNEGQNKLDDNSNGVLNTSTVNTKKSLNSNTPTGETVDDHTIGNDANSSRRTRRHRGRGKNKGKNKGKGKGEGEAKTKAKGKNTGEKNNSGNKNDTGYKFDISRIIDDIWIDVICFLTVKEFGYIKRTCNHFNKLICHAMQSISNNVRMNKFWKIQSLRLCSSIPYNYNTNDWYSFYFQIYKILQFGDYHNAQAFKLMMEEHRRAELGKIYASYQHVRPSITPVPLTISYFANGDDKPEWLDRCINPAWINDPFFKRNPFLLQDNLTGYAYFVSNNIEINKSDSYRFSYGYGGNNINVHDRDKEKKDVNYVLTYKQHQIKEFMEKYGMKIKDLNREKFNLSRFNQSLPIKLVTDDYGFDLQLIDLICFFDAQLVLDMLLFKNDNDNDNKYKNEKDNVYDIYYKFKPKYIGSDRYSRIDRVVNIPTNLSSKDIEEKYSMDALTLFYDYAAKHGSNKVFKYLIERFGLSSIPIFYVNDYILHHTTGHSNKPMRRYDCYRYDPVARNYDDYALTNILVAAMQGGDDEIINQVLNHPKLQFADHDDVDPTQPAESKTTNDTVDPKEFEESNIIKILKKKSGNKFRTMTVTERRANEERRVKRSNNIVYVDGIMDQCAVYGDYGACQLFIGYSNWENVKLSTIELIIDKFSKYINKSKQLRSPLHFTIECNQSSEYHRAILKTMLESPKIDVNVKNYQHYTPFLFACTKKTHKQVMQVLLESDRVDKFAKDRYKRNAIHLAVMYGQCELIEQIYHFMTNKMVNGNCNDDGDDENENENKQNDVLFDFFNSKEEMYSATPYILACRSLEGKWIKHNTRRRLFEILINLCKVDICIVDDEKLHGSHYVTYDEKLRKWLIWQEKARAREKSNQRKLELMKKMKKGRK